MSNKITKEENSFYKSYPVYKIAFKTEGRVREQYQVSICQNGRTLRVRWGVGVVVMAVSSTFRSLPYLKSI